MADTRLVIAVRRRERTAVRRTHQAAAQSEMTIGLRLGDHSGARDGQQLWLDSVQREEPKGEPATQVAGRPPGRAGGTSRNGKWAEVAVTRHGC